MIPGSLTHFVVGLWFTLYAGTVAVLIIVRLAWVINKITHNGSRCKVPKLLSLAFTFVATGCLGVVMVALDGRKFGLPICLLLTGILLLLCVDRRLRPWKGST